MQLLDKVKALVAKQSGFAFKKALPKEYFLALILKEKTIEAVVWEEIEGQVTLIDSAVVFAPKNVDEIEDEELLKLTDQAIGLAEKTLPTSVKTKKVIFGLNEWWVDNAVIKDTYLAKIKKICKELDLSPLGFVVISEAIGHLLAAEEGMPPTVLLVAVGEETIGVTLVRSGRIEKTKTLPQGENSAAQTAATIIKSFENVEVLPSRMLLFDGHVGLEETKQAFLSFPWTKEHAFLHFPKIDILPEQFAAKAVVSGAAKEMGFVFEEEIKSVVPPSQEVGEVGEEKSKGEEPEETKTEEVPVDEEKQHGEDENIANVVVPEEVGEDEAFGFVKDRDIKEHAKENLSQLLNEEEKEEAKDIAPAVKKEEASRMIPPSQDTEVRSSSAPAFLGVIFNFLGTIPSVIRAIKLPTIGFGGVHIGGGLWVSIGIGAFVVLLLLGLFVVVPKATVTVVPQTRNFENDAQITIDLNSTSIDKDNKTIPASTVEIKEEGEKSQKTTGKKTVGNKAKGEVTIYNKTENKKTFPKGTVLTGPSNLRFTLDSDVSIASSDAFALTPTSVKASVTADQIGEESNIAANTNLPFKDFPTSSYFAKNESAFSGGSKKDVIAVSKEDQAALLADLTKELEAKAKGDLTNQAADKQIVDVDMQETVDTKKFSKDVGEEANSLSLNLAISFNTLAYKNSDLLELLGSEIEKNIPQGFTFKKETFETIIKSVHKDKNKTVLVIHYKAPLTARIEQDQIKKDLVGKSKKTAEAILRSFPLASFVISQPISFPSPFDMLPFRSDSIVVEVKNPAND